MNLVFCLHERRVSAAATIEPRFGWSADLVRYATEIKVRAERRCGELLAAMDKHAGGRPKDGNPSSDSTGFPEPQTLADIGLTRDQSSRYQQLVAMPNSMARLQSALKGPELAIEGVDANQARKPATSARLDMGIVALPYAHEAICLSSGCI